jgi:hypothetical protein
LSITLLHTADWQIAKAFSTFPEETATRLKEQRIDTVKKIGLLATERKVDAVLVAGDVFDVSPVAEKTLRQTLNAMASFSGPWLLLPGNHDSAVAESVWSQIRRLGVPDNVLLLDAPEPVSLADGKIVVLPAPLQRRHEAADLTEWFDTYKSESETIRIGIAHGSVDNRLPERGEAPNTISHLRAEKADLDYLALGDWHGTHQVDARTWYSGTPETDRFKDNDSGNILLITIEKHGAKPTVEKIPIGTYRWRQIYPAVHGDEGAVTVHQALEALGTPYENLVVQVAPKGAASLKTQHLIAGKIASWDAMVRYLEYRTDNLIGEASEEDLEDLGRGGFIGQAVAELRTIATSAEGEEAEIANIALQLLYVEHKQTSR